MEQLKELFPELGIPLLRKTLAMDGLWTAIKYLDNNYDTFQKLKRPRAPREVVDRLNAERRERIAREKAEKEEFNRFYECRICCESLRAVIKCGCDPVVCIDCFINYVSTGIGSGVSVTEQICDCVGPITGEKVERYAPYLYKAWSTRDKWANTRFVPESSDDILTAVHTIQCNTCFAIMVKEDGCNKMVCPNCRQSTCALCRQGIFDYKHFWSANPGARTPETTNCLMYTSPEQNRQARMRYARLLADKYNLEMPKESEI